MISEVQGGAHNDIEKQAKEIENTIKASLHELLLLSSEELVNQRHKNLEVSVSLIM